MILDVCLIILTLLLMMAGFVGCVLPVLPGPALCFAGLVVAQFTPWVPLSTSVLVVFGTLTVGVVILDNVVPIWGTQKLGGTKAGLWGSGIGLVVAVVVLPLLGIVLGPFGLFGIILGPLLGAYIGEKIGGTDNDIAIRAALGSFVGFLAGTFLKLVLSMVMGGWVGVVFFQNLR